jgi:hypothetical protein
LFEQLKAQSHSFPIVQRQHIHRFPSDGRETFDQRSVPPKMVMPCVAPGMEEYRDLASQRVDSGEVRALLAIAVVASQSQVVGITGREVLLAKMCSTW